MREISSKSLIRRLEAQLLAAQGTLRLLGEQAAAGQATARKPTSPGNRLHLWSVAEKEEAIRKVQILMKDGHSGNRACSIAGVPHASFLRWAAAYEHNGLAGLEPKKPPGRPRKRQPEVQS